jgi:apolipoprotein N-acyltransferase
MSLAATPLNESQPTASRAFVPIGDTTTLLAAAVAVVGYLVCFAWPNAGPAILIALPALCLLARQQTPLRAFALGTIVGVVISTVLLWFMFTIFETFAISLWFVGALPYAIFLLLLNLAHRRLGATWALVLTPILWTGIEYFRSEVWALRFPWILPGQAAALMPGVRLAAIGVYGLGFIYLLLAALAVGPTKRIRAVGAAGLLVAAVLMYVPPLPPPPTNASLQVAGLQTEFWADAEIVTALDRLATDHPEAQVLVLSEYAFSGPVPAEIRDVVRKHKRYLIAGGKTSPKEGGVYNTAFVVGPNGEDVFQQVKSMPVQFINDGLPAAERRVWESPWGKIGIAICYDACYANVMDDFVRLGAQGLIFPTMDVEPWGEFERRMLHGRAPPVRSAEYGIPTFGVWSSGVSQLTDRYGRVVATADFPGQGETIAGPFDLSAPGRIPPDRLLAKAAMFGTLLFCGYLVLATFRHRSRLSASQN